MNVKRVIAGWVVFTSLGLAACSKPPARALGTLEYDRITLPAVLTERLVAVDVHEGQRVHRGQVLAQLDPAQTRATLAADEARVRQQQALLAELVAGPRKEDIAQARANLAAGRAQAHQARAYYRRLRPLGGHSYVSASDLDAARAASEQALGQVAADRAALDLLLHGTRPEDIAQARANLAAARDQAHAQRVLLDKLQLVAPRDGQVDSIPYKLGDQPAAGAPVVILLAGRSPYARIYVPETLRVRVHDGDTVQVYVSGRDQPYVGHVRMIRSEPTYTPYYALTGDDEARLSYLAQVDLGADAAGLPAGLPVSVTLPDAQP